jgi:hypothetical protein
MTFEKMMPIMGLETWGCRSGRHSYLISMVPGLGYCASCKDASSTKPVGMTIISKGVATFDAAKALCEQHARELHLK